MNKAALFILASVVSTTQAAPLEAYQLPSGKTEIVKSKMWNWNATAKTLKPSGFNVEYQSNVMLGDSATAVTDDKGTLVGWHITALAKGMQWKWSTEDGCTENKFKAVTNMTESWMKSYKLHNASVYPAFDQKNNYTSYHMNGTEFVNDKMFSQIDYYQGKEFKFYTLDALKNDVFQVTNQTFNTELTKAYFNMESKCPQFYRKKTPGSCMKGDSASVCKDYVNKMMKQDDGCCLEQVWSGKQNKVTYSCQSPSVIGKLTSTEMVKASYQTMGIKFEYSCSHSKSDKPITIRKGDRTSATTNFVSQVTLFVAGAFAMLF